MNTENNPIDALLQLYFDGQTTEKQEQELKDYFNSALVASEHIKYAALFSYFKEDKKQMFTKNTELKTPTNKWYWLKVAAVFLVSGIFIFLNSNPSVDELGTYQSPEEAFVATQQALEMLSSEINKGAKSVAYINEYTKVEQTIFNN